MLGMSFLPESLLHLALLGVPCLVAFGFGFGFGFGLECTQVMRVLILESSTPREECLELQYS